MTFSASTTILVLGPDPSVSPLIVAAITPLVVVTWLTSLPDRRGSARRPTAASSSSSVCCDPEAAAMDRP
jgi:hypothetical protein